MHVSYKNARKTIAELGQLPMGSLIITGLPGTGRKDIISELVDIYPCEINKAISHVTRQREGTEIHQCDHFFCTEAEFIAADLIAPTVYSINAASRYGTSLSEVRRLITSKKCGLFVTSSAGATKALKDLFGNAVSVVRITATQQYRYELLRSRYLETENGNDKVQHRIGFGELQENNFDDPFLEKIIDYTLVVKSGMTALDAAESILHHVNPLGVSAVA